MRQEDCVDFASEARQQRAAMCVGGCLPVLGMLCAALWLAWCSVCGFWALVEVLGRLARTEAPVPACVCERCGAEIGAQDAGHECRPEGEEAYERTGE